MKVTGFTHCLNSTVNNISEKTNPTAKLNAIRISGNLKYKPTPIAPIAEPIAALLISNLFIYIP